MNHLRTRPTFLHLFRSLTRCKSIKDSDVRNGCICNCRWEQRVGERSRLSHPGSSVLNRASKHDQKSAKLSKRRGQRHALSCGVPVSGCNQGKRRQGPEATVPGDPTRFFFFATKKLSIPELRRVVCGGATWEMNKPVRMSDSNAPGFVVSVFP